MADSIVNTTAEQEAVTNEETEVVEAAQEENQEERISQKSLKEMSIDELADEFSTPFRVLSHTTEELGEANARLRELMDEQEREHQEVIKKDWMKFFCHPLDADFSTSITDTNNFDGFLYSRPRCEAQARMMLRKVYDEAAEVLGGSAMYDAALEEIMDFAENRFTTEKLRAAKEASGVSPDVLEQCLDIDAFRQEIERKLHEIRKSKLANFSDYLKLVEYNSVDEDNMGFFANMAKNWNYNGYDAYQKIWHDYIDALKNYAKAATQVARSALKKRIEWKEELQKAS